MHLSGEVVKELIEKQGLVKKFSSVKDQLTANGFDMRLAAIVEVDEGGYLAVSKERNVSPRLGRAFVLKGFEDRLKGYDLKETIILDAEPVTLERLRTYLVITCEEVDTPKNLMFHIVPRSSVFRMTHSLLGCSVGEAGYKGFLTFMLVPFLESKIELGSRFAQLCWSELRGEGSYEGQKETNYQGGKLF